MDPSETGVDFRQLNSKKTTTDDYAMLHIEDSLYLLA